MTPREGIVELPLHLKWSGPRTYDLRDPRQLRRVYEIVLREGTSRDIRRYIDRDTVLAVLDDLILPPRVRAAWEDWRQRHGVPAC